jgi:hypothetical protein
VVPPCWFGFDRPALPRSVSAVFLSGELLTTGFLYYRVDLFNGSTTTARDWCTHGVLQPVL